MKLIARIACVFKKHNDAKYAFRRRIVKQWQCHFGLSLRKMYKKYKNHDRDVIVKPHEWNVWPNMEYVDIVRVPLYRIRNGYSKYVTYRFPSSSPYENITYVYRNVRLPDEEYSWNSVKQVDIEIGGMLIDVLYGQYGQYGNYICKIIQRLFNLSENAVPLPGAFIIPALKYHESFITILSNNGVAFPSYLIAERWKLCSPTPSIQYPIFQLSSYIDENLRLSYDTSSYFVNCRVFRNQTYYMFVQFHNNHVIASYVNEIRLHIGTDTYVVRNYVKEDMYTFRIPFTPSLSYDDIANYGINFSMVEKFRLDFVIPSSVLYKLPNVCAASIYSVSTNYCRSMNGMLGLAFGG